MHWRSLSNRFNHFRSVPATQTLRTFIKNTENENTRDIIYQTGLSGWYVRIIETGIIKQNDELKLLARPYPQITIRHLNRLLSSPENEAELEAALDIEVLAEAFKRSIRSQISKFKQQG